MKILVTFAVDWEFKPWLRQRAFQKESRNYCTFRSKVKGVDVKALLTGVGADNAVRSIATSLDEIPDLCITSGLAGGLNPQYRPGDVLVARAVCDATGETLVYSDERLFSSAVDCGAKPASRFISVPRVVRTVQEKSRLSASADAVDMESFAIIKELSGLGVPCVAIRSVSDSSEMSVPYDFDRALDASGRIQMFQVLGQVVCDPRRLWPLARLGVRSSRAAASLARFLDAYVGTLAGYKEKLDVNVQHINQ
jgi:nucleoside phosphorylase